jgi:hypothetical protein
MLGLIVMMGGFRFGEGFYMTKSLMKNYVLYAS